MKELLLAVLVGIGTYLLYSYFALHKTNLFKTRTKARTSFFKRLRMHLVRRGIAYDAHQNIFLGTIALYLFGLLIGWMLFGGIIAPFLCGIFMSTVPFSIYAKKRQQARSEASDHWPRIIDDVRLQCCSLGKPIPQAFFAAGARGPVEYRNAFAKAEREWLLSTNFEASLSIIKNELSDAAADTTCEALYISHHVGGSEFDRRLSALSEDRLRDVMARKDAQAKQSGVIFARRFVLIVPIGMAIAGMTIGDGRSAYESSMGQTGIAVALILLAVCWVWSGRLIRLPEESRVFRD